MRILIIGNEGTGKSYLADKLGKEIAYPVSHLDMLAWSRSYRRIPDPVFRQRLQQVMQEQRLILEGWATQSTMRERLDWADIIIYLCYPMEFCLKSVANRNLAFNYRTYPYDIFDGDRLEHAAFFNDLVRRTHLEWEPEVQVWLKEREDKKIIFTFYTREDAEQSYTQMVKKIKRRLSKGKRR